MLADVAAQARDGQLSEVGWAESAPLCKENAELSKPLKGRIPNSKHPSGNVLRPRGTRPPRPSSP